MLTSDETEKKQPSANDPLGVGHWPRWKQIGLFVLVMAAIFGAFNLAEVALFGSPLARKIKGQLKPLAEQLEHAQKVGDSQTVVALLDPTSKLVRDYNDLDEAKKVAINKSPLRYCVLASINLSEGVSEVVQTGYWISKDKYEAAIGECK